MPRDIQAAARFILDADGDAIINFAQHDPDIFRDVAAAFVSATSLPALGEPTDGNSPPSPLGGPAGEMLKTLKVVAATLPHMGGSEHATYSLMQDINAVLAKAGCQEGEAK